MITIKKTENGYGIFDGDRLVDFAERQQDYAGLVDTVMTVNAKLEVDRINHAIDSIKDKIKRSQGSRTIPQMCTLRSELHFLENYNA